MAETTIFGVPHYYCQSVGASSVSLVFIHGWLLSHKYWQPVMKLLQPDYTCVAYDLRGFGESRYNLGQFQPGIPEAARALNASTSPYGLAAYARDLGELLRQLHLKNVWLVGHSLGGSIALWTAYCYPELVKGVVCLNSGGGIYIKRDFEKFRTAGQQILRFRFPWMRHIPLFSLAMTRSMVVRPLSYAWGNERLQDFLVANQEAAVGALLESTTEPEVHLLPRIVSALPQPVYFLAGHRDKVMDLKFVSHLAGYHSLTDPISNPVTALPECGHMAMVEQPQLVASTIQSLLKCHRQTLKSQVT
jgi:2-succinyl-6-hydroxy-2,4-cyclohexadiene-1-carboxylate synthase